VSADTEELLSWKNNYAVINSIAFVKEKTIWHSPKLPKARGARATPHIPHGIIMFVSMRRS